MFVESRIILFAALLIFIENVKSWNTDELEVFDAADEIKQNFYGLLNVSPVSFSTFELLCSEDAFVQGTIDIFKAAISFSISYLSLRRTNFVGGQCWQRWRISLLNWGRKR